MFLKGLELTGHQNWNKPSLVEFKPKVLLPQDITVEIQYCGICGSGCHTIRVSWGPILTNDLLAGHKIDGKIVELGNDVKDLEIGQFVGIGTKVNPVINEM